MNQQTANDHSPGTDLPHLIYIMGSGTKAESQLL